MQHRACFRVEIGIGVVTCSDESRVTCGRASQNKTHVIATQGSRFGTVPINTARVGFPVARGALEVLDPRTAMKSVPPSRTIYPTLQKVLSPADPAGTVRCPGDVVKQHIRSQRRSKSLRDECKRPAILNTPRKARAEVQ